MSLSLSLPPTHSLALFLTYTHTFESGDEGVDLVCTRKYYLHGKLSFTWEIIIHMGNYYLPLRAATRVSSWSDSNAFVITISTLNRKYYLHGKLLFTCFQRFRHRLFHPK